MAATEQNEPVSLEVTEGTVILVAEVLRQERELDDLPMADAAALIASAIKSLT